MRGIWEEDPAKYLNNIMGVKVGSDTNTYLIHCKICYDFAIVTKALDNISNMSKSEHCYA